MIKNLRYLIAAVFIVVGLLVCFLGLKLFKLIVFLLGFIIGILVGVFLTLYPMKDLTSGVKLIVIFVCAILGGLVMLLLE